MTILRSWVGVALTTLSGNPLRTLLSTLGIIMGMASLVAVLSIGDGLEQFARDQVSRTTDLMAVTVAPETQDVIDGVAVPRADFRRFTMADRDSLAARLGADARVGIMTIGGSRVTVHDSVRGVIVTAATPVMLERQHDTLAAGRSISDEDVERATPVAVVSHGLAAALDSAAPLAVVGGTLRLGESLFTIVGVERPRDAAGRAFRLAIPFSTYTRAMPSPSPQRAPVIRAVAGRVEVVGRVKEETERWVSAGGGGARVETYSPARIQQVERGVLVFKFAMGAFAGIALLVGGIGIMNVLLASVTERTREIGIRKATGATHRDIMAQFLAESVAIAAAGSILGAGLGLGGAYLVTWLMRRQTEALVYAGFSMGSLVTAAAISVLTGLLFGTYPALRAARLSPIDAIRHE